MAAPGTAALIEAFHLAFLEILRKRVDPARYVLKGGANLRYFFGSVRYSEDIDLDAIGVPAATLERNVDAALGSQALHLTLRSAGLDLTVGDVGKPKQSETTQRWKLSLSSGTETVRTKIEFSHRESDPRHELETVPSEVARPYGLRPPSAHHYLLAPATEQKAMALAGRSVTQARDVFDLDLLLRRAPLTPGKVDASTRRDASDRALELPYAAFADQVAPFLDPEVAELYDAATWEQMQLLVSERLMEEDK